MKIAKTVKRIAIDAAGYTMLVLAVLLGWLPGPGGMPLFFGGLALLSINNEWAKRLKEYLIKNGSSILNAFFPDRKIFMALWDIAVILALSIGAFAFFGLDGFFRTVVATMFLAGGLVAFARNRRRFERFAKKIKKNKINS